MEYTAAPVRTGGGLSRRSLRAEVLNDQPLKITLQLRHELPVRDP